MQFYTPTLAVFQILTCSKNVTLPRYVIAWQLTMRLTMVTIVAATMSIAFLYQNFDQNDRNCLLSHELRANSFYCLNKLAAGSSTSAATVSSFKGALYSLGLASAVLCAASMLALSHGIFKSFTAYLDKLIEESSNGQSITDDFSIRNSKLSYQGQFINRSNSDLRIETKECQDAEPEALLKAPLKPQVEIEQSESQMQIVGSPAALRTQSHSKKKKQQQQQSSQLQDQSISSFRALLDRESDSSSFLPLPTHESGYDSSFVGQMSMSTQADRQGGNVSFFNMSQGSSRDIAASGPANKRFPQAGAPDLLPIDEDVDDEKCSPIKPKRRTEEDSPFKKHLNQQRSMKKQQSTIKNGNEIQKDELVISDEDEMVDNVGRSAKISVNGFGIELDQAENDDDEDISSLNLNSALLATPKRKVNSSSGKSVEPKLDNLIEDGKSDRRSQNNFRIQVEQVADQEAAENNDDGAYCFEGIGTLNSGATGDQVNSDQNQRACDVVLSGPDRKNLPSIQVNSFSNVDESTLQLETIAPFKHHRVPSSTRNGLALGTSTDQGNMQTFQQQPLSVREVNRPATGLVNLGMITPFHAGSSNNEMQTDDRNSLGFGLMRNTVDVLSSDIVSKTSGVVRPNSTQSQHSCQHVNTILASKLGVDQRENTITKEVVAQDDEDAQQEVQKPVKKKQPCLNSVWCICRSKITLKILITTAIVGAAFCTSLDAYFFFSAADEGLAFAIVCVLAAVAFDFVLQILILLGLAAAQFYCEVNGRRQLLQTAKLEKLTKQAQELARQVFHLYEAEAFQLNIGKQDEPAVDEDEENLDILLADRMKTNDSHSIVSQHIEGHQSTVSDKDFIIKDSVAKISLNGFCIEIRERLKFKPPQQSTPQKALVPPKINLVQPKNDEKAPPEQMAFSSGDEEAQQKKKNSRRFLEVGAFERSHKFFAGQMPITQCQRKFSSQQRAFAQFPMNFSQTNQPPQQKHLRKRKQSTQKKSAKMLRQSIENVELENIEGDFSSCPVLKIGGQPPGIKNSQTPEKLKGEAMLRQSLAGQSSSRKVSQFETPRMSQVKLKHQSVTSQADGVPSDYDQANESVGVHLHRKLSLKRTLNNSESNSNRLLDRLDSVKKFVEDDYMMQGVVSIIFGNSSKSITVADGASRESSIRLGAGQREEEVQKLLNDYHDRYEQNDQNEESEKHDLNSQNEAQDDEEDDQKQQSDKIYVSFDRELPKGDKYSPVFSSVNRKDVNTKPETAQQNNMAIHEQSSDREIQTFGNDEEHDEVVVREEVSSRRNVYAKQILNTADFGCDGALNNESSSSQVVQVILSHREALSKQHSFNSPNSLQEKLQMTSEKIQSSIDNSSIGKGRRKMIMLDEADVSRNSLNYGGGSKGDSATVSNNTCGAGQSNTQKILDQVVRLHQVNSNQTSSVSVTPMIKEDFRQGIGNKNGETAANSAGASAGLIVSEPMSMVVAMQQNSQVLMEDQGDFILNKMLDKPLSQSRVYDYGQIAQSRESNNVSNAANKNSEGRKDVNLSSIKASEEAFTQIRMSGAKRSSNASVLDNVVGCRNGSLTRNSILGSQQSAEKSGKKGSNRKQSAFQRLVEASKRMMQRKSSEKKDGHQRQLNQTEINQPRANSLSSATDTAHIMKEQSKVFSQPFKIGFQNRRIAMHSENNQPQQQFLKKNPEKRSSSDQTNTKNYIDQKKIQQAASVKHKTYDNQNPYTAAQNIGSHLQSIKKQEKGHISEILEQESMEMDTPLHRTHEADVASQRLTNRNHDKLRANPIVQRLQKQFNKRQIEAVKIYQGQKKQDELANLRNKQGKENRQHKISSEQLNQNLFDQPLQPATRNGEKERKMPGEGLDQAGACGLEKKSSRAIKRREGECATRNQKFPVNYLNHPATSNRQDNSKERNNDYQKVLEVASGSGSQHPQSRMISRGFRQRKKSQLTSTKEGCGDMILGKRRVSKNSHQQLSKLSESRGGKRHNTSSREGTLSSCSIDFERMDKQRDSDLSDGSKLFSQASLLNRLEDQRRRLESFLSLAQQAKSKRDIDKIQGMIRQIDETGKPLPMSRINELKLLELMASPYNQSLIAMIKVELDIAKKAKDLKKAQLKAEHSKSKYSLPKHLTSIASRAQVIDTLGSQDNLSQPPCVVNGEGDTRLTRVVTVRPTKGISSCRSNNDVAMRKFQRSPEQLKQQSPLSQGFQQPVLSSKGPKKYENSNERVQENSAGKFTRYSYLRSVGNAVVVQENIQKSVDRIRKTNEKTDKHLKSKSDLDMLAQTRFEEVGLRGAITSAFVVDEFTRIPKSSLNYNKPELMSYTKDSNAEYTPNTQLVAGNQLQLNERSHTQISIPDNQKVGAMMLGQIVDIQRMAAAPQVQSKSALI